MQQRNIYYKEEYLKSNIWKQHDITNDIIK
jgi:hypothetical protein